MHSQAETAHTPRLASTSGSAHHASCTPAAPDQQRHALLLGAVAHAPLHVVLACNLSNAALQHRCSWWMAKRKQAGSVEDRGR